MNNLALIFRNPTIYIAFVVWCSFWPLAYLMSRPLLFDLVNALATSGAAGVLVGYRKGLAEALIVRPLDLRRGHLLILGIYCTWGPLIVQRIWAWAWRLLGKPVDMPDHVLVAWLIWIACSGAALHLRSTNAIEGRIPPPVDTRVGAWTAAGVALFFLVSWLGG